MDDADQLGTDALAEVHALFDAWTNQVAGLGTAADDRAVGTFLCPRGFLSQYTLEEFYKQNPIAKRIVNRPADDATRTTFQVKDIDVDVDMGRVMSKFEELKLMSWLNLGLKWKRLYGGALGIFVTNDRAGGLDKPLDERAFTKIRALHVVDRFHATPRGTRFQLNKTGFLIPEQYEVRLPTGKIQIVHKTRTVRFDGIPLPPDQLIQNQYWGLSELEAPYDDVRRLYVTRQYLENFVHEASIAVLKIEGLRKMLATKRPDGGDPKKAVTEALQNLRRQATNFHWIGLDSNDSYEMHSKPSTGLEAVDKSFVDAVVMSSDIPRSILLGETPGGLNTGENAGEIRSYYDWISVMQNQELTPIVTRALDLMFWSMHNSAVVANMLMENVPNYPVPRKYTVKWDSLWQQDDSEIVAQAQAEAQLDKIYVDMGVVTVDEVRQARIVEGMRGPLQIAEEPGAPSQNGAAVTVVQVIADIVEKVATGLIPAASAVELILLAQPSMTREQAEAIVAPASIAGEVAREIASSIDPTMEGEATPEAVPSPVDDMPTDLKSAREIGTLLGVSPATIRGMGRRGEIRYWKVGAQLRYSLSEAIEASDPGGALQVAPRVPPPDPISPVPELR